jgi:large subunit ribosomal protein L25
MSAAFTTLAVKKRNRTGKGANRRLRAADIIPAVLYTRDGKNIPVQVDEAPLMKIFTTLGRTSVFNVEVEDGEKKTVYPALLWDLDFYPTKNRLLHVDFFSVDLEKELKVRVPLEFVGTAKGTKIGGVLETFMEQLDILCKPLSLPGRITVDVSALDLNQSLRVDDLPLPEGVRAAGKGHVTVVAVNVPSGVPEEGEEAAKE